MMHSLYGDDYIIRARRIMNEITYSVEDCEVGPETIWVFYFTPYSPFWEEMLTKFSTDFSKAEQI